MSYGEAVGLVRILARDPSSQVAAALAGWRYSFSRADALLADLFDLTHQVAAGKRRPKPYARPWEREARRVGAGTALTPAQFRAAWDA